MSLPRFIFIYKVLPILSLLLLWPGSLRSESEGFDYIPSDYGSMDIGGDIFNDFNEDLESTQIMSDERFFHYGRYFNFNISLGMTTFDGNRGRAYQNNHPSYGMSVNYFSNFQTTFGIGFEFSKHFFILDEEVHGHHDGVEGSAQGPGLVNVSVLRFFFASRHYFDTSNFGTAIAYSNPYAVGRFEYWYVTNKFEDQKDIIPSDRGGGTGFGVGAGLEFPIEFKKRYLGVELLWHVVNFHDKYTQNYAPVEWGSGFGHENLAGNVWSIMTSYVINW